MIYLANISEEGGGGHRGCGGGWIPQCFTGGKTSCFPSLWLAKHFLFCFGFFFPVKNLFGRSAPFQPWSIYLFSRRIRTHQKFLKVQQRRVHLSGLRVAQLYLKYVNAGAARVHLNAHRAPPCSRVLPWNYTACSEITHDTHSSLPRLTSCASPARTPAELSAVNTWTKPVKPWKFVDLLSADTAPLSESSACAQTAALLEAYKFVQGRCAHTDTHKHRHEVGKVLSLAHLLFFCLFLSVDLPWASLFVWVGRFRRVSHT